MKTSQPAMAQTIGDWMREVCIVKHKSGQRLTGFALVHMLGGGTAEDEMYSVEVPENVTEEWLEHQADICYSKAENYANGIPGPAQTFCVQGFHGNAAHCTVKKPFFVTGAVEFDGLTTEAAGPKGFLQQAMRYFEGMATIHARKEQALFEVMAGALRDGGRERAELRGENTQMFGLVKELIQALSAQTHNQQLELIQARESAKLRAEIVKLAPDLLSTLTGKELVPQPVSDSRLIEGMIDAIANAGEAAQDFLPMLQKLNLPPAQLTQLAGRIHAGLIAREKEQASRKKLDATDPVDGGMQ